MEGYADQTLHPHGYYDPAVPEQASYGTTGFQEIEREDVRDARGTPRPPPAYRDGHNGDSGGSGFSKRQRSTAHNWAGPGRSGRRPCSEMSPAYQLPPYGSSMMPPQEEEQVPPSAPRLTVRTDLPVERTSFLDLVAYYVVQGGPTLEEELNVREEQNPNFAFLNAPHDDPEMIYYRWRLYSLLQGDEMLRWRTEPFQVESGPTCYAFVPPPAVAHGPEILAGAYSVLQNATPTPRTTSSRGPLASSSATDLPSYPPPSATWLSRAIAGEGRVFATLNTEELSEWTTMLDYRLLLAKKEVLSFLLRPPAAVIPSPLPPLSTASGSYDSLLTAAYTTLFHPKVVAARMVFAVDHAHAAQHVLGCVLDHIVRLAYDSATVVWTSRGSGTSNRVAEDGILQKKLGLHCLCVLWYLFIIHDTIHNASAEPMTDAEIQQAEEEARLSKSRRDGGGAASPSTKDLPTGSALLTILAASSSGPSTNAASNNILTSLSPQARHTRTLILEALEAILPTLLEAVVLVCMATLQQCSPAAPPSVLGTRKGLCVATEDETTTSVCLSQSKAVHSGGAQTERQFGGNMTVLDDRRCSDITECGAVGSAPTGVGQLNCLKVSYVPDKSTNDENTTAAAASARLLLSWLRQLVCWWTGHVPELRDIPMSSNLTKSFGKELVDRTPQANTLRGRVRTMLAEKYTFLLDASEL